MPAANPVQPAGDKIKNTRATLGATETVARIIEECFCCGDWDPSRLEIEFCAKRICEELGL